MMRGMYAAISGLEVHQTMLDVTANNLANVDTIGYKAQRTTFADELSQTLSVGSGQTASNGGQNPMQVGLGVQLGSIDNLMQMGSLQSTGSALDVAIQGEGFFRVGNGAPNPSDATDPNAQPKELDYTRAGNFRTDPSGYLTTQSGMYVIGKQALTSGTGTNTTYSPGPLDAYIKIPTTSTGVSVGQDGSVTYLDEDSTSQTYQQRVTAGYLSLVSFPNQAGLQRNGGSLWSKSANSGDPSAAGTPNTGNFSQTQTISGSLEMSNVDLATEFTNMITAQRGYEANSKVITTADQMLQAATQMKQ